MKILKLIVFILGLVIYLGGCFNLIETNKAILIIVTGVLILEYMREETK